MIQFTDFFMSDFIIRPLRQLQNHFLIMCCDSILFTAMMADASLAHCFFPYRAFFLLAESRPYCAYNLDELYHQAKLVFYLGIMLHVKLQLQI
jgi:hypothetical protein